MEQKIFTNRSKLLQEVITQVKNSITTNKYSIRTIATHTGVSKTIIGYLNQSKANKASLESLMRISDFLGIKYSFTNTELSIVQEPITEYASKSSLPKFKIAKTPSISIADNIYSRFRTALTKYINEGLQLFFRFDKNQITRLEKKYYTDKLDQTEKLKLLEHYANTYTEYDSMIRILKEEVKRMKAEQKQGTKMFEKLNQETKNNNPSH